MTGDYHDVERATLGALLIRPEEIDLVRQRLAPDDFADTRHGSIYAALLAVARRGTPVDIRTVQAELERQQQLNAVGGVSYLASLDLDLPDASRVESYAAIVAEGALQRATARAARTYLDVVESGGDTEGAEAALARAISKRTRTSSGDSDSTSFKVLGEDRFRLSCSQVGVVLDLDYVRRESRQLKGELLVRCDLPGARTHGGVLAVGDVNLSSTRARALFAKYLDERAQTDGDVDWPGMIEQFAQLVLGAERAGNPDVALHEVAPAGPAEILNVGGLRLPRRHPTVVFGDGDSAKSYLALWLLGELAEDGLRVGLADWELTEDEHRERLERLFGTEMPEVRYLRCQRPITSEADRLRHWVRDRDLDFVAFDSVAFACAGAPESAEVAMQYFQVIRQLGRLGTLHIAHVTKGGDGSDRRPFGSTFWFNSPRALWYAKAASKDTRRSSLRIGLYPRKFNLGPWPPSAAFELDFAGNRTTVRGLEITDETDLASALSVPERIWSLLRSGPHSRQEIEAHLDDVNPGTLRSALSRAKKQGKVVVFPGPNGERYSLPERRRG